MASIWDAPLKDTQQEKTEYPTLPAGEYTFQVVKATGKEYTPRPGAKIGKCAEIDLQLRVESTERDVTVFDRLYSDPQTVWKMTAFAKSIGVFKAGMTPGELLRNAQDGIGKAFVKLAPASNGYPARNEIGKYIEAPKKDVEADDLPF